LNGDVPNEHDACLEYILKHKETLLESDSGDGARGGTV